MRVYLRHVIINTSTNPLQHETKFYEHLLCGGAHSQIYGFPSYAPKIHRIRINGDSVQILQTIALKRPNGMTATGLLNSRLSHYC
jgi:hypothetical protein